MKELKIGDVLLNSPFILAPMAGFSDSSMRRLCVRKGAALTFTEMVSAKGIIYENQKTNLLLSNDLEEHPIGFQLFGREEEPLREALFLLEGYSNEIIDFNLGCPAPKIVKNGQGSALLREQDKIYSLMKTLVENTKKPVTAKIRIGWDEKSINHIETVKTLEAAGVSAITVHGRTREQYYRGESSVSSIIEVRKNVKIPVIANGDALDGQSANRLLEESGADFVMIGRGAIGNPWIFKEALAIYRGEKIEDISFEEKKKGILEHFDMVAADKGEKLAMLQIRKHIPYYVKGFRNANAIRRLSNSVNRREDIIQLINSIEY